MQNRIIEVASDDVHLSLYRGFLKLTRHGEPVGQVAIDDIGALIIRGFGASFSVNICTKLAQAHVPIVLCGANQAPVSVIWPIQGHHAQGLIMQQQALATKPLNKQLWAQIVRAKIQAQAAVLAAYDIKEQTTLRTMAKNVKSGDSDNLEAQAAKRYWPALMGENFRRSGHEGNINGALNYGYAVLRAATARSCLAAGLHPSLSIHHQSRGDALRLADDLMEPFRPWVDYRVKQLLLENSEFEITPQTKARLTSVLQIDCSSAQGASPIQVCMDRLAQSLAKIYQNENKKLVLDNLAIPLSASSMEN